MSPTNPHAQNIRVWFLWGRSVSRSTTNLSNWVFLFFLGGSPCDIVKMTFCSRLKAAAREAQVSLLEQLQLLGSLCFEEQMSQKLLGSSSNRKLMDLREYVGFYGFSVQMKRWGCKAVPPCSSRTLQNPCFSGDTGKTHMSSILIFILVSFRPSISSKTTSPFKENICRIMSCAQIRTSLLYTPEKSRKKKSRR